MRSLMTALIVFAGCVSAFADTAKPQAAEDDVEHLLYMGPDRLVVFKMHLRVDGKNYRKVWTEQTDKYFDELDANKDGVLSGNELQAVPSETQARQFATPASRSRRLPTVSKNLLDNAPRDGKVSREELRVYLKRIGFTPFSMQIENENANRNPYVVSGRRGGTNAASEKLFELLDRNDDGKLSAQELKSAVKSLRKTDFDDDGTISSAELGPTQAMYGIVFSGQMRRGRQNNTEFLSVTSSEMPSLQTVRKFIQRYDQPLKASNRGDGKLSQSELKIDAGRFSRFDRDGDGNLDSTELRYFLRKPPANVEMVVRLGKREKGEKLVEIVRLDKDLKSLVRRVTDKIANLRLATSQLDIGSNSSSRTWGYSANSYDRQFDAADADNNGYLTNDESRRNGFFRRAFAQMDTDNDGKVFKKEVQAYVRRQSSLALSRTILNINDQGRDLFKILDSNRDQRLSRQELAAALDRIPAWDLDADKQIAKSEIPRQYRLSVDRGTPGGTFPVAVATPYATNNRVRRQYADGPKWFRGMDLNGDGEVSSREFLGRPELFNRIDTNNDKHISPAEAGAAGAKQTPPSNPVAAPRPTAVNED